MDLVIAPNGTIRGIYGEEIHLQMLGRLHIQRASHVEPTSDGNWQADLSPVQGPMLGPFAGRSAALQAEQEWLQAHWLVPTS